MFLYIFVINFLLIRYPIFVSKLDVNFGNFNDINAAFLYLFNML